MKHLLSLLLFCITLNHAFGQHHIIRLGAIKHGSFAMASNGAYLYCGTYGSSALRCYDITNPATPTLADSLQMPFEPYAVATNTIYSVVGGNGFIALLNTNNPNDLILGTTLPTGGQVHSIHLYNDNAFALVANNNTNFRVRRYAVSFPGTLTLIDSMPLPGVVAKMVGNGMGRLYVATGAAGMPQQVAVYDIGGGGISVLGAIAPSVSVFQSFDVLYHTLFIGFADSVLILDAGNVSQPIYNGSFTAPYGMDLQALDAAHFTFSQYLSCYGVFHNDVQTQTSVFNSSNYWLATAKAGNLVFYSVSDSIHILSFEDYWNGTPQMTLPALRVYPNPASNELYIHTVTGAPVPYELYNVSGCLVQSGTTERRINTAGLAAGAYLLVVNEQEKRRVVQVMLNK